MAAATAASAVACGAESAWSIAPRCARAVPIGSGQELEQLRDLQRLDQHRRLAHLARALDERMAGGVAGEKGDATGVSLGAQPGEGVETAELALAEVDVEDAERATQHCGT